MEQVLTAKTALLPLGAANKVRKWLQMLEAVYATSPVSPEGVLAWTKILGRCDEALMDDIVMDWVRNEDRHPKPAQLLRKYETAAAVLRKRQQEQKYAENGETLFKCPYCRDTKYILAEVNDEYGTRAYPCGCSRHGGNLAKALEDPAYEFDWDYGIFRLVNRWIGEEKWVG